MLLSKEAHKGQKDKTGNPYFLHPQNVVKILLTSPSFLLLSNEDKTTAITTAWLHDVVEDTDITLNELKAKGFSESTIYNVSLLTFNTNSNREEYYRKILTSEIARCVKVSDVAHNSMKERLLSLTAEQREKLINKYSKSILFLLKPNEENWFHKTTKKSLIRHDGK